MTTILDPLTLPLTGNSLIEASAGTGKTYTLSLLYVRLVLGHGRDLPLLPPQILVLTYTNAATEELRERLRVRLLEAVHGFRHPEAQSEDWLQRLRQDYTEQEFPACARKLELAAQWMDQAAISTIHSWSQRMLREYTFATMRPSQQEIETDESQRTKRAVTDYWRTYYAGLPKEFIEKFPDTFQSPEHLLNKLDLLLKKQELLADMPEEDPQVFFPRAQKEINELKKNWGKMTAEAKSTFGIWYDNNAYEKGKLKKNHLDGILEKLREWTETSEQDWPDINFESKTWQRLTRKGMEEIWKQPDYSPADLPLLQATRELPDKLADLTFPPPPVLIHAARWVNNRLNADKEQHGVITYDDLLKHLYQALAGVKKEELARAIRQQFPVALIDEFQDTDAVQYAVFDAIYDLSGPKGKGTVILIGDPKQAIYAFRGADIFTYLQARRALKNAIFSLDTNYRSSSSMVEAVNTLFTHAEENAPNGAFGLGAGTLPFYPVHSHSGMDERFLVNGSEYQPVTLWWLEEEGVLKKEYREKIGAACASQITRLLHAGRNGQAVFVAGDQKRPVTARDMAILVNSGSEAKIMREALRAFHVSSVYLSERDSVFENPVCNELLIILEAIVYPLENKCRQALATRLLGLSLEEQEQCMHDQAAWEKWQNRFFDYHLRWRQHGILVLLTSMIHDFEIASRLLTQEGGERDLTDLLHLGELLQTEKDQGPVSVLHSFRRALTETMFSEDVSKQRLESEQNCVRIITVHKAKGLEYPLVFFPFPVTTPKKINFPLTLHNKKGQEQFCFKDNRERTISQAAQNEILCEELRKFYVAMTRSRHAIWMSLIQTKDFQNTSVGQFFSDKSLSDQNLKETLLSFKGVRLVELEQENEPPVPPWQENDTETLEPARTAPVFSFPLWRVSSYSSLSSPLGKRETQHGPDSGREEKFVELATFEQDENAGSLEDLPPGPQTGNLLHKILEMAAKWTDISGQSGFSAFLQDETGRHTYLKRQAILLGREELVTPLENWACHILTASLDLKQDTLVLQNLKQTDMQTEMEFLLSVNQTNARALDSVITAATLDGQKRPILRQQMLSGMVRGFIDLVVQLNGRYYIVDWKSNYLGSTVQDYTEEKMTQAILAHRYDVQYSLYLLALHRLLQSRLPDYCWETHVGGAAYIFLRGRPGIFLEKPPVEMIEKLDALFRAEGRKEIN